MTMRIFTYQTLDAAGEPTVAGIGYDLEIYDLSTPMSNNFIIQELRDGRELTVWDSEMHYEVKGNLLIPTVDIDKKSINIYLGNYRYLGPNLYHHYKYHNSITLFLRGINNTSAKAYVCYIVDFSPELAAQATLNDIALMHFSHSKDLASLKFGLEITLSGAWSNFDDITSVVWESRT